MVVVCYTKGGAYMLAVDGTISKLRFTAFHVIPYYPHSKEHISVTEITGVDEESIDEVEESESVEPEEEDPEDAPCT
jgi:hypothetical protein